MPVGVELSTLGPFLAKTLAPFEDAQSAVKTRSRGAPPPQASAGERYIVAAAATGVWAGRARQIAERQPNGSWSFVTPVPGMSAWIVDENVEVFFNGTEWNASEASARGVLSNFNKRMPARATTADGQRACDIAVSVQPIPGTRIYIEVNGLKIPELGDGTKVGAACYFSRDGGYTALLLQNVSAGDVLYWQASVAGYQLEPTDVIEFVYEVA